MYKMREKQIESTVERDTSVVEIDSEILTLVETCFTVATNYLPKRKWRKIQ